MLRAANLSGHPRGPSAASSEGDKLLQKIAKAGREWKQTVGRKVDMECEFAIDWTYHTTDACAHSVCIPLVPRIRPAVCR
jgi:hypothetical protein